MLKTIQTVLKKKFPSSRIRLSVSSVRLTRTEEDFMSGIKWLLGVYTGRLMRAELALHFYDAPATEGPPHITLQNRHAHRLPLRKINSTLHSITTYLIFATWQEREVTQGLIGRQRFAMATPSKLGPRVSPFRDHSTE